MEECVGERAHLKLLILLNSDWYPHLQIYIMNLWYTIDFKMMNLWYMFNSISSCFWDTWSMLAEQITDEVYCLRLKVCFCFLITIWRDQVVRVVTEQPWTIRNAFQIFGLCRGADQLESWKRYRWDGVAQWPYMYLLLVNITQLVCFSI